jgi:ABC-2 type transport system permease protein
VRVSWKKYTKTFAMGLQSSMEYRTNFVLGLMSGIFPIAIQIFLWKAIFHSSGGTSLFGYTEGQAVAYAILAALFSRLVAAGFEHEIASDVKNGQLSKFVVQPIRYFWFRLCTFLGEKSLHVVIIAALTAVITVFFRHVLAWDAGHLAVCLAALALALGINFLIYFNLSMLSFWMAEVWGVFLTFSLIASLASGGVFPLDMFGDTAQAVLNALPFRYIVFFPVSVLLGKLSAGQMLLGLLAQLSWIAVLTGVSAWLWSSGMKKYESVGG